MNCSYFHVYDSYDQCTCSCLQKVRAERIGSAVAGRIPAEREEPRAPDIYALLGHPMAEGVSAAPESDDTVTIVGGEAKAATVVGHLVKVW